MSLGLINMADAWVDFLFIINPANLLTFFWKFLTGKISATNLDGKTVPDV
jgi:hypothetical protein